MFTAPFYQTPNRNQSEPADVSERKGTSRLEVGVRLKCKMRIMDKHVNERFGYNKYQNV